MNVGKKFENDFKKSIPDNILLFRLPDAAQAFGGGNLRFSRKNPFDYLLFNSDRGILFALELKTVKNKTISFERSYSDHGDIHYHQIVGLNMYKDFDNVTCGFIIEFRKIELTIFLNINEFNRLLDIIPKKSFNVNDLSKYEIKYTVIPQRLVRTRYRYDINNIIDDVSQIRQ